jgi:hypothetical protein
MIKTEIRQFTVQIAFTLAFTVHATTDLVATTAEQK